MRAAEKRLGRLGAGIPAGIDAAPRLTKFIRGGAGFTPARFMPRASPLAGRCAATAKRLAAARADRRVAA